MPFPCCAHALLLPCLVAKGLECVFPISLTQCGRVWFTLAMSCSDYNALLKATAQHGRLSMAVLCCGLEKNGMVGAWYGHGMGMAWQVWITHGRPVWIKWERHILNPLWHGMAEERHGNGMLCVNRPLLSLYAERINCNLNFAHLAA